MIKSRNTSQYKPETLPMTLGKFSDEVKEKMKNRKKI